MIKNKLRNILLLSCSKHELKRWYDPLIFNFNTTKLDIFFPHTFFEPFFKSEGKKKLESAFEKFCFLENISNISINYVSFQTIKNIFTPTFIKKYIYEYNTCTFKNYFFNNKNIFTLKMSRKVANLNFIKENNPFLLYGNSGVGKTHILKSIYNDKRKLIGSTHIFFYNIIYLEYLLMQYSIHQILKYYNFFIIDNVHMLSKKYVIQKKVTNFLDFCISNNIQIIFSCTGNINKLEKFSDGLLKLIKTGLILEIKDADIDIKMRFTEFKALKNKVKLSASQIFMLALYNSQLGKLNDIILRLRAYNNINNNDILAILNDKYIKLTPLYILNIIANHFNIKKNDIIGNRRNAEFIYVRKIAIYICRVLLNISYPKLAFIFGKKDHSTIIYSFKKIEDLMVSNKDVQILVTSLKNKCIYS